MLKNPNSNLNPDAATTAEIYAALNRNDIPGVLKFFDPQVERVEPDTPPATGIYRGLAEVEPHFTKARNTWAEGACAPEEFFVAGDKVVVFVHVKVRLKDKTDWIEGRIADGFTFKNGKVTFMRTFLERKDALQWAGITAQAPNS